MAKPVRIFKIEGNSWMRGLSRQTSSTYGGLFSSATNFDPFEKNGILQPSLANTTVASTTGSTALYLTPFSISGVGYVYAHGATKFYRINVSSQAVTDDTANVTTSAPKGADVWRGKYVYALDTEARTITLAAGTDTQVLASLTTGVPHNMTTGPDLYEYITNGVNIARLILETGTTGNTLTSNIALEIGQVAQDVTSDGRNLVIISDNNPARAASGDAKCVISYWDCTKVVFESTYEIDDAYLIGVRVINGVTHIIGYNGIWVCNVDTAPKLVFSFTGNSTITHRPNSSSQIKVSQGILYWGYSGGGQIYGYGNRLDASKKIFFQPFASTGNNTAIAVAGNTFYSATDTPSVYVMNTGSTRDSALITVAPVDFEARYQFSYVKIVLNSALVSGQSCIVAINSLAGSGIVTNAETKTFASDPNKRTLLFYKNPAGNSNDVTDFEEFSSISLTAGKLAIKRLEVWAEPLENEYQA